MSPRMMLMMDWYGTVAEVGPGVDWGDPESVRRCSRPFQKALARIRDLLADDWEPYFLSEAGGILSRVVFDQVQEWLGARAANVTNLAMGPYWDLSEFSALERRWDTHAHLVSSLRYWVEEQRRRHGLLGAVVYVSDSLWGLQAARDAGAHFLWAHEWREGRPVTEALPAVEVYAACHRAEPPDGNCTVLEGESGSPRRAVVDSAHPEASP